MSYGDPYTDILEADTLLQLSYEREHNLLQLFVGFPDVLNQYKDRIREDYFCDERHRQLYRLLLRLDEKEIQADRITLTSWIRDSNLYQLIDDEFINGLYFGVPAKTNVIYFIEEVIQLYQRRELSNAGVWLTEVVRDHNPNINQIINTFQESLTKLASEDKEVSLDDISVTSIVRSTLNALKDKNKAGMLAGVSTGFPALDAATNGLKPGELIIVAGRPASGKSTFAMNICEHLGYKTGDLKKPIVIFTLEMPSTQVMMRSIANLASVNQKNFQTKSFSDTQFEQVKQACSEIARADNVFIDDSSYGLTVEKVRARVRQIAEANLVDGKPQMGLVMIDYLQLLDSEQSFKDRHLLIAHIAKSLKALAREFECPVVALSQLNRNVETRGTDSRPTNADLRESGAIEQDADIIMMVHRPETNAPPEQKEALRGKAEIIITKNRQGEIGTYYCLFQGQYSRFSPDSALQEKGSDWRAG